MVPFSNIKGGMFKKSKRENGHVTSKHRRINSTALRCDTLTSYSDSPYFASLIVVKTSAFFGQTGYGIYVLLNSTELHTAIFALIKKKRRRQGFSMKGPLSVVSLHPFSLES